MDHYGYSSLSWIVIIFCKGFAIKRDLFCQIFKRVTYQRGQNISADLARLHPGLHGARSSNPDRKCSLNRPGEYLYFDFSFSRTLKLDRFTSPQSLNRIEMTEHHL